MYESYGTIKSFALFTIVKANVKLNLGDIINMKY